MKTKLIYRILIAALIMAMLYQSHAQTTITSGSHVVITNGTTLTSMQNFNVSSGGNLQVNGTLNLKKDLVNQNATPDDLGAGLTQFTGTTGQNVSGENIFQNLQINNAAGMTVGGNTQVNGVFTLTNGLVSLGSSNLQLGASATIAGVPSSSAMVVPTGSGELRKEYPGYVSFTFPVGDATGTTEYSPVTISYANGGYPAGNYAGVRLVNDKYPDPNITGNYLNRYWNVSVSGLESGSTGLTFQYVPSDVSGNEASLSCSRVYPQPWATYGPTDPSLHQLHASGVYYYGAFTGLKSTTTPGFQELTNMTIGNGISTCYDATSQLTVAGYGNTFSLNNGGSVTLVAGQKISILPGATVYAGGYLHGYISTNGIYCGSALNPLVTNVFKETEEQFVAPPAKDQFIRIYPNPATDIVNVEITGTIPSSGADIDLYNMSGQRILAKAIQDGATQHISLAGLPVGVYMIHAWTESRSEIVKVVKK